MPETPPRRFGPPPAGIDRVLAEATALAEDLPPGTLDGEEDTEIGVAVAISDDGTAYLDDDTEIPAGQWEEADHA